MGNKAVVRQIDVPKVSRTDANGLDDYRRALKERTAPELLSIYCYFAVHVDCIKGVIWQRGRHKG